MQSDLQNLGERATSSLAAWTDTYSSILAAGVSPDATNGRIPGLKLSEVGERISLAVTTVSTLSSTPPERLELISPRLEAIKAAMDSIDAHAANIRTTLGPYDGGTATDQNGHLQIQLKNAAGNATNYDLGTTLFEVYKAALSIFDAYPYIALVKGEKTADVFAGVSKSSVGSVEVIRKNVADITAMKNQGTTVLEELKAAAAESGQLAKQIQERLQEIGNQKSAVDASAAEVQQKLALVREVAKDADTLQQRVTGFTAQFEAFDTQMSSRLQQFAEFEANIKTVEEKQAKREATIDELTSKADTMIRGATTAGLSKSLDDAKQVYEDRLDKAQKYFIWSAAALFVCTLPLAGQLIPGPWQQYFAASISGEANQVGPWLAALGKVIFLIPATWATAFFASNYAELFHLSREYAHKAALAKSIDGFKREAPEYAQEIVGSVFMEIQDNPGSRKAPPAATPQNPITKKFLERVLEAIKLVRGKE